MNKHLFSLVCVTALATVASAEVLEPINGVTNGEYIRNISLDSEYINKSVGINDWGTRYLRRR